MKMALSGHQEKSGFYHYREDWAVFRVVTLMHPGINRLHTINSLSEVLIPVRLEFVERLIVLRLTQHERFNRQRAESVMKTDCLANCYHPT